MKVAVLALFFALCAAVTVPRAAAAPSDAVSLNGFDLAKGDTVALLGGTFLEREGNYGFLETALTQHFADYGLKFRNLAWSADTVFGHSRSYFGPPSEGLDRLRTQLQLVKPTVVVCQYGAAEAWEGKEKVASFVDGYRKLLDLVAQAAPGSRVVLLSPAPTEVNDAAPPLARYAADLPAYRDAIRSLAEERRAGFVDLLAALSAVPESARPLTENGLHFSESGYRWLGSMLPVLAGGQPVTAPDEKLRALIVEKNRLFFHRYRPANETYLFGFRKHEQGNNGAEIPLFDPLVEQKDREIAAHAAGLKREP